MNLKDKHKQIENLFKSIFADLPYVKISYESNLVSVIDTSKDNSDPPRVDIIEGDIYIIDFWDGYSAGDRIKEKNIEKSLKHFKKFLKKLHKQIVRFS